MSRLTAQPARTRSAFTLLELAVASAVSAILLASMTSLIVLASHGLPSPGDPAVRARAVAAVQERLVADVAEAYALSQATPTRVELTRSKRSVGAGDRFAAYRKGVIGDDIVLIRTDASGNNDTLLRGLHRLEIASMADHYVSVEWAFVDAPDRIYRVSANATRMGQKRGGG